MLFDTGSRGLLILSVNRRVRPGSEIACALRVQILEPLLVLLCLDLDAS